jgi:hypothetical protein
MAQAKRRNARRKEQYSLILGIGDSAPLAKITSSGDKAYRPMAWTGPAMSLKKSQALPESEQSENPTEA